LAKISILASPSKPAPGPEKDKDTTTPNEAEFTIAKQVVVKVQAWEEAPEEHVGLSPQLAATLDIRGLGDVARFIVTLCRANFRVTPAGSPVKKSPSKLTFHPFSNSQSAKSNALRVGGDKAKQKEATNKDKETSAALQESLRHIFNGPITQGMRVVQSGDSAQSGMISFSGHHGDWFQPRSPDDCTISLGREITYSESYTPMASKPSRQIVSINKLLDKAEKTLGRNGSVLVCGGRGAGKSAALTELSQRMHAHLVCTLSLKFF
jgi:hypothetical protein